MSSNSMKKNHRKFKKKKRMKRMAVLKSQSKITLLSATTITMVACKEKRSKACRWRASGKAKKASISLNFTKRKKTVWTDRERAAG